MKSLFALPVWLLVSASVLLFSFTSQGPEPPVSTPSECRELLTDILEQYRKQVDQPSNLYMVLEQESLTAEGSHTTRTEIAKAGERARIENDLYTVFRDDDATVMVSKTAQTVIIRPSAENGMGMETSASQLIDSLMTRTTRIDCADGNTVTFWLDEEMLYLTGGVRKVELEYDPATHMVLQGRYHFVASASGIAQQTITYGAPEGRAKGKVFKGSAVAQVLDNSGALKEAFRSYELKDLRTISTQK